MRDYLGAVGILTIEVFDRDGRIVHGTDERLIDQVEAGNQTLARALSRKIVSNLQLGCSRARLRT